MVDTPVLPMGSGLMRRPAVVVDELSEKMADSWGSRKGAQTSREDPSKPKLGLRLATDLAWPTCQAAPDPLLPTSTRSTRKRRSQGTARRRWPHAAAAKRSLACVSMTMPTWDQALALRLSTHTHIRRSRWDVSGMSLEGG